MTDHTDELAGLPEDVRGHVEIMDARNTVNGSWNAIRAELLRLAHENAICREAVEDAVAFVKSVDSHNDDDGEAASRRCVERRLSEAIGKACPRLMYERPEGQKFYGLHYRELTERAERAEAELAALKRRIAEAKRVMIGTYPAHGSGYVRIICEPAKGISDETFALLPVGSE